MKNILLVALAALVLVACSPSADAVQTAIAETEAAKPTATPTLTLTPSRTNTPTRSPYLAQDAYANILSIDMLTFTNEGNGWHGVSISSFCEVLLVGKVDAFEQALLRCSYYLEKSEVLHMVMGSYIIYLTGEENMDAAYEWFLDEYKTGIIMTLPSQEYASTKTFGFVTLEIVMTNELVYITATPAE